MAAKKKMQLTANQTTLLRDMPDDSYVYPGSLEAQSYRKLELMGYAESKVMRPENRPAYKRTPFGRKFIQSLPTGDKCVE